MKHLILIKSPPHCGPAARDFARPAGASASVV